MLKKLSLLMILCLIFQYFVNDFSLIIGSVSFFLLITFLIIQTRIFSKLKLENPHIQNDIFKICAFGYFLILIWCSYFFISNYSLVNATSLSSLSDLNNIGLYYKANSVILPALAWCICKTIYKESKIKYMILILTLISCTLATLFTLSKAPIIGICLVALDLIKLRWYTISIGSFLLIFFLVNVYELRGQTDNLSDTLINIINRFPLLNELNVILTYLFNNIFFDYSKINNYAVYITEEIFKKNANTVGIAPGGIPSFILLFNVFSPFVFYLVLNIFVKIINMLSKINQLGYITSSLLILEITHSLIDGLPHFYTSTNNGLFFWGLILLIILSIIYGKKQIKFSL